MQGFVASSPRECHYPRLHAGRDTGGELAGSVYGLVAPSGLPKAEMEADAAGIYEIDGFGRPGEETEAGEVRPRTNPRSAGRIGTPG